MCLPKSFVIFDVPATISQQSQLYQTLSTKEISGGKCTSDNNSKMYQDIQKDQGVNYAYHRGHREASTPPDSL